MAPATPYQRGLADGPAPNDLSALVRSRMYDPRYLIREADKSRFWPVTAMT